jgi:hypothetical protein
MTNHLKDPTMVADNPWPDDARYDTMFEYFKEAAPGTVDWKFIKMVYASDNTYNTSTGQWVINQPGTDVADSSSSTSLNIFHPVDLTAYLGTGKPSGTGSPAYDTGQYAKLQLLTNPGKIAAQADADTNTYYWAANTALEYQMNLSPAPAYLTEPVISDIKTTLNNAYVAYSSGMDRRAYGDLATDATQQIQLYSDALTYYVKAQMLAQLAQANLVRAEGN